MKLAIVGSRELKTEVVNKYLTEFVKNDITEIVTGGAKGVDTIASNFAVKQNLKLTLFLPDYTRYKKGAPLKRNISIAEYSDKAIIFWNGKSKGTSHIIQEFRKRNKKIILIMLKDR